MDSSGLSIAYALRSPRVGLGAGQVRGSSRLAGRQRDPSGNRGGWLKPAATLPMTLVWRRAAMWKLLGVCLWVAQLMGPCWAGDRPADRPTDSKTVGAVGRTVNLLPLEQRWLQGIAPVLAFARATGYPLDVIVQPQDTPGHTPLAVAFVGGRCKLVLSMRGNVAAQDTLDAIPPDLLGAALELMAAHELGHCERYLAGAFARPAAGFNAAEPVARAGGEPGPTADPGSAGPAPHANAWAQALRREEAYADLIGLAWTRHRHPQLYTRLHAWLLAERSSDMVRGSAHDTQAWLRLVRDGAALADPAMFSNATRVWAQGLLAGE